MADSQRDLDMRALEYIYEHGSGPEPATPGGLRKHVGEHQMATCAQSLIQRGLIRRDERVSGGWYPTAEGRSQVEELRDRRANRGLRRRLCRDELLRWLDSSGATDVGTRVSRDKFDVAPDGLPFTEKDSHAAAEYLKLNGLIESFPADGRHLLLWITDRGQECRDEGGDVAAFVKEGEASSVSQVFHISGSGNNVAAALGDNNEVTANLSAFDAEKAIEFAAAVWQALPQLGLDRDQVSALIADIEQRDDPTRAQRATATLQTLLVGTTTGTLGQMLGMFGSAALGMG